jgi:SPX domain protein involved in polyphosphate accumulation
MKFAQVLADSGFDATWLAQVVSYADAKKIIDDIRTEAAGRVSIAAPSMASLSIHEVDAGTLGYTSNSQMVLIKQLDDELAAVNDFVSTKADDIQMRVKVLLHELEGSKTDAEKAAVQSEATRCGSDLLRLEKFININVVGFIKIVKKHDRYSAKQYEPLFRVKLQSQPFLNMRLNHVLAELSSVHELLRGPEFHPYYSTDTVEASVLMVRRFWIKPQNITELKWQLLQHIPLAGGSQTDQHSLDDGDESANVKSDSELMSVLSFDNELMQM